MVKKTKKSKIIDSNTLKELLQTLDEALEISVYCSYNNFELKRVTIHNKVLLFEVGETKNITLDN